MSTSVCSISKFDMNRRRLTTVPGSPPTTASSSTRMSPLSVDARRWITRACSALR